MSDALIDELIGRGAASRGQVEEAKRRLDASGGHLVERLVEVGCAADRVLAAWAASTGIPAAPRSALARPILPVGLGVPPETWRELPALPFGTDDDGNVLIAVSEPSARDALLALDLPDAVVHLATPSELAVGLARAFPDLFEGAGPATAPGGITALPLDEQGSLLPGDELPTMALPKLQKPGARAARAGDFELPPTAADDLSAAASGESVSGDDEAPFAARSTAVTPGAFLYGVEPSADDVLRRLAAEAGDDLGGKTLSHTLDLPGASFEEDDGFDGPTQAVDSAQLLPFLQGAEPVAGSLPTRLAEQPASTGASAFDDDEPKTVAMTVEDIRASLKARGAAPPSTARSEGPAPPASRFPEVGADEGDDEFEPKTVAMSVDEMRTSLGTRRPASPTADDARRTPRATTGEPAGPSRDASVPDAGRVSFDYSAAADGFDDGEGRGLDTSVRSRATHEDGDASLLFSDEASLDESEEATRAAAMLPAGLDVEGDDFDEKTLAADGFELFAPPAPSGAPSARADAPAGDERRVPLDDDDELLFSGEGEPTGPAFDAEAERKLAEARTKMALALEEVGAVAPSLEEQHSAVFVTDDDDPDDDAREQDERPVAGGRIAVSVGAGSYDDSSSDEEATHAGVDPVGATRISAHGGVSGSADGDGDPTAGLPARAQRPAAPPVKEKAVDTAPTGPIAVRGYEVKDVLGAGGMATVYRAWQRSAEREVALKILAPHLANDTAFVARFQREIRSSASLTHPNIIRVYDYGDEAGVYYMATEVMDGGSLRDALHDFGALPVPVVVKLLEHLLRGVGHAHKRGMVHRDIKPANLMLSSEGLLKLGDFGIAKSETDENLTRTGALFGTPAYMSPEQALGRAVEPPSDLFACGIIGYELLTGENPYQADTASASLLKVSRADAPPLLLRCPAAPPLLVDVIERLQRRDASERYASADEALSELGPLVEATDRKWPALVQRYVADPRRTIDEVAREHANAEYDRARHHLGADPPLRFAGATAAYLATVLDPDHVEARQLLADLCAGDGGFHFGVSTDARVHDAERALEDDRRAPGLLRRVSDLYRAGGNPFKAAVWLRQYLAVKPTDSHARHQLGVLVGPSALAGFDDWEVPIPELTWDDVGDVGEAVPEDTQVPPSLPVAKDPSAELDLLPLGFAASSSTSAPAAPALAPPLPPGVRPALRTSDPSEMLKAAAARARGGLQVLKSDGPPTPAPSHTSPASAWSPGAASPVGPALQQPQQTYAVPRAGGRPPERAGIPKALKVALAAALSLTLLLVVVIVAVIALSGEDVDPLVREADPGTNVSASDRQVALLAFARARLSQGDGVRALQATSLAYDLAPGSPHGGEALLLRGRAYAAVGDPKAAAKDFEQVTARFPEGNLLHLEARQQLKELPK